MRAPFLFLLAASLAGGVASAAAIGPAGGYAVEVLVFRFTGPGAARGETWPASAPAPATAGAIYPPAAPASAYAPLSHPAATIAAAAARLRRAPGYALVAELGWRQPAAPASAARPVSLAPLTASAPAAATGAATASIAGTVTVISANRKPNVALDLRLCEPTPSGVTIEAPAVASLPSSGSAIQPLFAPAAQSALAYQTAPQTLCFGLAQRRFVSLDRLEYFDNPAFGVLVLVRNLSPRGSGEPAP